jgi:hypothetical protein
MKPRRGVRSPEQICVKAFDHMSERCRNLVPNVRRLPGAMLKECLDRASQKNRE